MSNQSRIIYSTECFCVTLQSSPAGFIFATYETVPNSDQDVAAACDKIRLLRHPSILQLTESTTSRNEHGASLCIQYQHMPQTLSAYVRNTRLRGSEEVDSFASKLLGLMEYLQLQKLHHSNISPNSLFVKEETRELKLGFFQFNLNEPVNEYRKSTMLKPPDTYNAEARAIACTLLYLIKGKPAYELLELDESNILQLLDSYIASERLKSLLRVLLLPAKFNLNFQKMKEMFDSGQLVVAKPAIFYKCLICPAQSYYQLPCGHNFCAAHNAHDDVCPRCTAPQPGNRAAQEINQYLRKGIPTYLPPELRQDPETVSSARYHLSSLSKKNPTFNEVSLMLLKKYSSWRNSALDNNSFCRCLGVAWLEKLFRANAPERVRVKWRSRLGELDQSYINFSTLAKEIIRISQCPRKEQMNMLQSLFLKKEFDELLVSIVRALILNTTERLEESQISSMDDRSFCTETGEINIPRVREVFKYEVHIYKPESKDLLPEPTSRKSRHVAMLLADGRYVLLYSILQDCMDGYDYTDRTCHPIDMEEFDTDCRYT